MTTTQGDPIQQALGYMRYQGAKSLDDLVALMDRTGSEWSQAFEDLSEARASFQPDGEWCAKEVLNHVLLSNRGINQQIAEMAGAESPRPSRKITDMGQMAEEYAGLSVDEIREVLRQVFEETKKLLRSLSASDKLDQSFPHPLFGPLSLKEWFAFHRVHAMDHIQQIAQIKADAGYPKT